FGLSEALGPGHGASVSDRAKSATPASVDAPRAVDEPRELSPQAGPASDAPGAAASSPANSTTSRTNVGAPEAKTASAPAGPAEPGLPPPAAHVGDGLTPVPSGPTRLEPVVSEGVLNAAVSSPGAYTG